MSLSDEESIDAKKELDDIDYKFDKTRVANSVTGRGEFTFRIWILGLSEVRAFIEFYIAKLNLSSSLQVYLCTVYQHMNLYILTNKSVSVSW